MFVRALAGSITFKVTTPTPLPIALIVMVQLFVLGAMLVVEVKEILLKFVVSGLPFTSNVTTAPVTIRLDAATLVSTIWNGIVIVPIPIRLVGGI